MLYFTIEYIAFICIFKFYIYFECFHILRNASRWFPIYVTLYHSWVSSLDHVEAEHFNACSLYRNWGIKSLFKNNCRYLCTIIKHFLSNMSFINIIYNQNLLQVAASLENIIYLCHSYQHNLILRSTYTAYV